MAEAPTVPLPSPEMFSGTLSEQTAPGVEERVVDDTVGRGVFATRVFKEDEVIFEELPLVSCQFLYNKEYGYLACDHCLKSLETAEANVRRLAQDPSLVLPHAECGDTPPKDPARCPHCQTPYCCELCRDAAWRHYHKTLCHRSDDHQHPLVLLQQEWKQHHYPPETLNIMLVARLLAGVRQSEDPGRACAALAQFCHATRDLRSAATHKLLGDDFHSHLESLRRLMDQAVGAPEIKQWLTTEGFQSLLVLVGSNGQGVASSPLAKWAERCEALSISESEAETLAVYTDHLYETLFTTVGSFLDTEGSALYRLQSRVNHSCRPNATPTFPHNSHLLTLTALGDIEPGEQITISYLDECSLARSRHSRHKTLKENYVFVCRCEKCQEEEDQADVTSSEDEDMDEEEEDRKKHDNMEDEPVSIAATR